MNNSIILIGGLLAALHVQADVVSWNLDNNSTVGGDGAGSLPASPAEAGVVLADFWSNSFPADPTTNLRDDSGNPTTLDIAYDSDFGTFRIEGSHPGQDANGSWNKEMINGYLNGGTLDNGGGGSSVTITQIPYADYDIYVYFGSDVTGRTGTVTDGATTYSFSTIGAPSINDASGNAVLTQTTDTATGYPASNYAVFENLSGTTQTISSLMVSEAGGGIAAFQIVGTLPTTVQIVGDPMDQTVAVDEDASFTVSAAGDLPHTYQWEYSADGINGWSVLPDETNATLDLFGVDLPDEGFYRATVTGSSSSATSEAAELDTFYATPLFFEQPADLVAEAGTTVEFTADADTYGAPQYQWYKDGSPLTGEEDSVLTLTSVGPADEGEYFLRVTDGIEPGLFADSEPATLVTYQPWTGLYSQEPFDIASGYALGDLPTQDPAITGYDGPWEDADFGDAEPAIMAGSLTYPNPLYLGSTGDMVGKGADAAGLAPENSGRTFRLLAPELVVADNTTGVRYLSFLYRNGNENAADLPTNYSTLALYQGDTADANRNFEAGVADDAGLGASLMSRINNNGTAIADFGPLDSDVHLFVVKFDLSDLEFDDTVTVWMDPTLGGGEPVGEGVVFEFWDIRFDRMVLSDYASNSVAWDEVRWGDSFDGVTLNPNPPEGFAGWIAGFDVGDLDGFNDDADGDGLDNGVEYYLNTDPSSFTPGLSQAVVAGNTFSFQHPQNGTPPSDVTAGYRWSLDLAGWNADGASSGGTTVDFSASPDTPVAGTTTVTATITGTMPTELFTDLEVTQVAP